MQWSTLVPVLVGGAVALVGSVYGAWVSDRRAMKRETRAWDREDQLRTFDDRRRAYLSFVSLAGAAAHRASQQSPASFEETKRYLTELDNAWRMILIYGMPEVFDAALDTYGKTYSWALADSLRRRQVEGSDAPSVIREKQTAMEEAHSNLIFAVRADLGVPTPEKLQRPARWFARTGFDPHGEQAPPG